MKIDRVIKKGFTYPNLVGKTIHLECSLRALDVYKLANRGILSCKEFIERRPDFTAFDKRKIFYGTIDKLDYVVFEQELEV